MANKYVKKMSNVISHQGNEDQNYNEIPPDTYWTAMIKKIPVLVKVGRNWTPSYIAGGNTQ